MIHHKSEVNKISCINLNVYVDSTDSTKKGQILFEDQCTLTITTNYSITETKDGDVRCDNSKSFTVGINNPNGNLYLELSGNMVNLTFEDGNNKYSANALMVNQYLFHGTGKLNIES